jgi:cation diffusion facilitator family transporter
MANESTASVLGAIVANFAIAAVKLVAALAGGSAAMLSEAIHSTIDGVNDLLLLFGLKRSRKPADAEHPFGHGNEVYFWALMVSCSVLGIGGGVTILEGVRQVMHPEPLRHVGWAYGALACGAVFDAGSFFYGLHQFRVQNRGKRFWEAIREAKDPASLMVIVEDSAGFVGELFAAFGLYFATHGWHRADGIASVLIGCLLSAMALFLIAQTHSLVLGVSVEDDISEAIRKLATGDHKFLAVRRAQTVHFGPETVLVTLDAEFDPNRPAGELIEAVDQMQRAIRERFPAVKFVYLDPEAPRRHQQRAA